MLIYWTSKIGISTQWVRPVLIHAYCITTIPACKVGQNIYLRIICPQVHDVLNIQHWGEGWWCLRRRDCNSWNEFIASPWDNAFTEDKQNLCRFPLVPLAVCCSCQGLEIRSDVFCASALMLFSVFSVLVACFCSIHLVFLSSLRCDIRAYNYKSRWHHMGVYVQCVCVCAREEFNVHLG